MHDQISKILQPKCRVGPRSKTTITSLFSRRVSLAPFESSKFRAWQLVFHCLTLFPTFFEIIFCNNFSIISAGLSINPFKTRFVQGLLHYVSPIFIDRYTENVLENNECMRFRINLALNKVINGTSIIYNSNLFLINHTQNYYVAQADMRLWGSFTPIAPYYTTGTPSIHRGIDYLF